MIVFLITFLQSASTTCLQRGVYFFTREVFHFSDAANLALAFATGAAYVAGALLADRAARRWGPRRWLAMVFSGLAAGSLLLMVAPTAWSVPVVVTLMLGLDGAKWPVVESFMAAGHAPAAALRQVGWFNISWASACVAGLVLSGPIIAARPVGLFLFTALLAIGSWIALRGLPRSPAPLPADHAARPNAAQLRRLGALCLGHRALLVLSYLLLFLIAPLLPRILHELGFGVGSSAALAGLLDGARLAAFVILQALTVWHGRRGVLAICAALLVGGFALMASGLPVAAVLAGEGLFGFAMGWIYYGALYYAMVARNAAVEAGGHHEALIGSAIAGGPLFGLLALGLAPWLGGGLAAMMVTLAPVLAAAAWVTGRAWKRAL